MSGFLGLVFAEPPFVGLPEHNYPILYSASLLIRLARHTAKYDRLPLKGFPFQATREKNFTTQLC
jgi:hypothetical protein